jgi:arylformamidase
MIIDISQPLGPETVPWPGEPHLRQEWISSRERGDRVNVAEIRLAVHLGTHVDGPAHTGDGHPPIAEAGLEPYVGLARVRHAIGARALGPELLDGVDLRRTPRVLFRSRARVDLRAFPHGFAGLTAALAERLVAGGARLVGTDAPSVDPQESEALEVHRILREGGVAILENVVLDDVPEGEYTLVAAPLKLVCADSSPVRALLIAPDA